METTKIWSTCGKLTALAVAASAALPMAAYADVAYSIDGNTLTVMASDAYENKGLKLLWDSTDKGDVASDWSNSVVIVDTVPSIGGTYSVDLAALGITNGTPCRIASYSHFARLNMLKQPDYKSYFDTGVKDTEVYGVRFGYYSIYKGTSSSKTTDANNSPCIGSIGSSGGFVVYANDSSRTSVKYRWRGVVGATTPDVKYGSTSEAADASKLNEFAFTNGVFTLDGEIVASDLGVGVSSGTGNNNIAIGTSINNLGYKAMYGYWSHVSFDGADGNKIRDYIPVQRTTDNKVGFFDRVTGSFNVSTGTTFTAVSQTGEMVSGDLQIESETITHLGLSAHRSTLTITVPSCFSGERLMVFWDDSDRGDDAAAWAHSATVAEVALAGTYSVRMSSLGIKNGQFCRVAAGYNYQPLDMLMQNSYLSYVSTGIRDTEVYGLRFGYYSVAKKANTAPCIGSVGISNGGFLVLSDEASRITLATVWRGEWLEEKPTVKYGTSTSDPSDATKVNEFAFTNGVFTIDGSVINDSLGSGLSVGKNGIEMSVGTGSHYRGSNGMYGWWSHVSFDGADGNKILDYIPAKRTSDDVVGFYDRVSKRFMTSSGTGGFTAGSVKDEASIFSADAAQTFRVSTIPGVMVVVE